MLDKIGDKGDRFTASVTIRAVVPLLLGLIVAVSFGPKVEELDFWIRLGITIGSTYLAIFYITESVLRPEVRPVPMGDEQQTLIDSITAARRTTYAISSNWIDLWNTIPFRQYLAIDSTLALAHYSSSRLMPLEGLSSDRADQQAFMEEAWANLERIGQADHPVSRLRIRLLIYPEWVYSRYGREIGTLIQMHSLARIPCIPIVSARLAAALNPEEAATIRATTAALGQNISDKLPPLAPWERARYRTQLGRVAPTRPAFDDAYPDMLLTDAAVDEYPGEVHWYRRDGHVQTWSSQSPNFTTATRAFEIIARHAKNCRWPGYGVASIGAVAIGTIPTQLDSEAFFSRRYYADWLDWIDENRSTDPSARQLDEWQSSENKSMMRFVDRLLAKREQDAEPILGLDAGCGFGRHTIELLKLHTDLKMLGIDINSTMTSSATVAALGACVDARVSFYSDDLATLETVGSNTIDFAICMTNTLGNITGDKRHGFVARLGDVLKPEGQVFFSCYNTGSTQARLNSYKAIDLDASVVDNSRIVTSEGLVSESFTSVELQTLLESAGLETVGQIQAEGKIAWRVVARRPPDTRASTETLQ